MNQVEAISKEQKRTDKEFCALRVGSVAVIGGVYCRLMHINHGKGRLTFMPVEHAMPEGQQ